MCHPGSCPCLATCCGECAEVSWLQQWRFLCVGSLHADLCVGWLHAEAAVLWVLSNAALAVCC
jgi:hypothetical protein